jgi:hypothetical protein
MYDITVLFIVVFDSWASQLLLAHFSVSINWESIVEPDDPSIKISSMPVIITAVKR